MPLLHAVLCIDHHHARILQFDAEAVHAVQLRAHAHYTRQHASVVRSEHEFFGHVCDELASIKEVLVTGSHTAQADFRHYVEKHRSTVMAHIAGWETVDHPSEGQLLALARGFFLKQERMAGIARPN